MSKTALVMAGGTGGHIFPGLAVAEALRERGWRVHWLGAPGSMEAQLVPPRGFSFETVAFGGVRGKGLLTLAMLPLRLLRAFWQSLQVVRRVRPDVVVGLGGYISFPGGMMAVLAGKPLVLHEQNSVAGMANKVLAGVLRALMPETTAMRWNASCRCACTACSARMRGAARSSRARTLPASRSKFPPSAGRTSRS